MTARRVAIVTGSGRGLGRATAVALARAGFALGLVARTGAELDGTRDLLTGEGATAVSVPADVTDPEAIREAVATLEDRLGHPITVLVNNAGTLRAIGPLWEVDPEDWRLDVRTSLFGAFVCCRELLPRMIEQGEGRIVNLVSYVAVRPAPYQTGYAAGKAGLVSLTEGLAASLEGTNVKVFAFAPGFTETEMTRNLAESDQGRRWLPEVGKGRIVDPEASGRLIAWLASGAADALNGRVIHSLDDPDELLRRVDEIRSDELYVPRLRRLPGDPNSGAGDVKS